MPTEHRVLTYSDYLEMPEEMGRYEIVDGEIIYMTPAPGELHQRISGKLFVRLYEFVSRHRLGVVYFAPIDIVVEKEPLRTRQPDLVYISREKASILRDRILGGPDLVIEILSPGNPRRRIVEKLQDYGHLGVVECWLVSPESQTIEVLELSDSHYLRRGLYAPEARIDSGVLSGIDLPLDQVFASAFDY